MKLYFVDMLLALSFLGVALTGIFKFPGFLGLVGLDYRQLQFLGLNTVHDYSGLTMVFLVLVHLAMHWRWMVLMTRRVLGLVG